MATQGAEGIDFQLPDGVDDGAVAVTTGSNGEAVVTLNKNVKESELTATGDTTFTGKNLKSAELDIKADSKKATVNVTFDNNFKKGTFTVDKGVANITFNGNVKGTEGQLGKGNDTLRFGAGSNTKGCTFDMGKGGKDTVIFDENAKIKCTLTSFGKKDKVQVGDETFTGKDFNNGAEVKGLTIEK